MEDLKDKFTTKKTYPRLIDAEYEDYAKIIEKHTTKNEWLGHISGNHPYAITQMGVDPMQALCNLLQHGYLGYSAFVPLQIDCQGKHLSCMLLVHHGYGGASARKEGSGINNYIDHALRFEGWDIALYGHRHDRWVKTVPRIRPQEAGHNTRPPWVKAVDRKVAQCGTYLRTLAHSDAPTYSERAGYPPRPLGCLVIKLGIQRLRDGGRDNIILKFLGSNE